jgi:hypothetical protein
LAQYPPIPAKLRQIDPLVRLHHFHLCSEDDCYYLWEWDAAPYATSAVTDFVGNFQKDMKFRNSHWPWHFKKQAILHAARAIRQVALPQWKNSVYVPVPPSKIKDNPGHDPRLIVTLEQSGLNGHELVLQLSDTESKAKNIPPHVRANNWRLDLDSLTESPEHFVVFDDLLTGASHFAGIKLVLARKFPDVPVSGLFLARRLLQSQISDPSV